MIILGIDPGSTLIGYGVVKFENSQFSCLEYGAIRSSGLDALTRFKMTTDKITELVNKHKPDRAGVEKLFFFNNQRTAMAVSEMRGVIMNSIAGHGIKTFEFTPLQVKQFITGYGKADKKQVQQMAKMLLRLKEEIKPDDAADALAIAMCCAGARE